jgi:hypothetical protein
MDEILTHLDANGRKLVGNVLRMMINGPKLDDADVDENKKSEITTATSTSIIEKTNNDVNNESKNNNAENTVNELLARDNNLLLGGGAYETVMVILQDQSAIELEEAFNHIDIVVKDGDESKVFF